MTATDHPDRPSPLAVLALRLGVVWLSLLMVGFYGGLLGWRGGAFLMLAGACGSFAGHMVVGVTEYRRVMSRAWPKVAPLVDDDW